MQGVSYRSADGKVSRVVDDAPAPNGVLLSRDEKTLLVADGDADRGDVCQLLAYPVKRDGSVGPGKSLMVFAPAERGIEGMCLDSDGNIVACAGWKKGGVGPSVYVISASGTVLETHPVPSDFPMRCAFGDAGLGSLYVTAGDGGLYRATNVGRQGFKR